MLHYHGTPITPQAERDKMAGRHFCVSFADARDAEWCIANGQSVMWDNGAFTVYRQGGQLDLDRLYAWLDQRLAQPHWAVIPDRIGGDQAEQSAMVATWPFPRALGAPVWHMGLGIDYLLRLADEWPRICFGSSAQFWRVGDAAWQGRADEAFNALAKRHRHMPWVHMLRGLSLAGQRWPFASADSVNVARNFKDVPGACPERMAARIDAVQCPVRWTPRMVQLEMIP